MNNRTEPTSPLVPLTFQPLFRRALWGGTRLASLLAKSSGHLDDCSESWEVVDLADEQSTVESGPWSGWTLGRLVKEHGEALLGRHAPRDSFPLLLKFLDATDRLSLQVHPDNVTAARHHPGCRGKTEAWVILSAAPGSRLWAGLQPGTTPDQLVAAVTTGDINSCVGSFEARVGQCVVVPAGTVHAIGEGIVLAEIQQSSDLTYRLHDWGRIGTDGTPRRIDIERGIESVDFDSGPVTPTAPPADDTPGQLTLVERPEFHVVRHRVVNHFELVNDDRCRILATIAGTGSLEAVGTRFELSAGCTVLLPATVRSVSLDSDDGLTLLDAHLP